MSSQYRPRSVFLQRSWEFGSCILVVQVLEAMVHQQVIIIAGETGCGKTTQVPQFILDHAAASGRQCRVLCSQPRRISAITVASRVAAERGEGAGASVGYSIRLESVGGPKTSLMFVTTGAFQQHIWHSDQCKPLSRNLIHCFDIHTICATLCSPGRILMQWLG